MGSDWGGGSLGKSSDRQEEGMTEGEGEDTGSERVWDVRENIVTGWM